MEKVGRGMVEQVEEGPRPNLIRRSNSSENASMSRGLSEKKNNCLYNFFLSTWSKAMPLCP